MEGVTVAGCYARPETPTQRVSHLRTQGNQDEHPDSFLKE